jgi:hypothetical protein
MRKQGIDLSIFTLSYVLAPQGIYPMQIKQALSALKYLVEVEKRDPATVSHVILLLGFIGADSTFQILIGGDSAGGNLASALLLHLGHPHPQVPGYSLKNPLRGALLISPWISFETESPSFKTNKYSDYLTVTALNRASTAFVGPENKHDNYSEPINAPVEWWREVATYAVRDVLIWGGGGEVLIDGISTFGGQILEGFARADAGSSNEKATIRQVDGTLEDTPIKERNGTLEELPAEASDTKGTTNNVSEVSNIAVKNTTGGTTDLNRPDEETESSDLAQNALPDTQEAVKESPTASANLNGEVPDGNKLSQTVPETTEAVDFAEKVPTAENVAGKGRVAEPNKLVDGAPAVSNTKLQSVPEHASVGPETDVATGGSLEQTNGTAKSALEEESGNVQASAKKINSNVPESTPEKPSKPSKTVRVSRATLLITPHEAHEEMIMDYVLLISKKGDGAKEIENWMVKTLKE